MIQTTPVSERSTRFSCPNPQCTQFNRPGAGNIAHRAWTGTHKHIERLRCTACDRHGPHALASPALAIRRSAARRLRRSRYCTRPGWRRGCWFGPSRGSRSPQAGRPGRR